MGRAVGQAGSRRDRDTAGTGTPRCFFWLFALGTTTWCLPASCPHHSSEQGVPSPPQPSAGRGRVGVSLGASRVPGCRATLSPRLCCSGCWNNCPVGAGDTQSGCLGAAWGSSSLWGPLGLGSPCGCSGDRFHPPMCLTGSTPPSELPGQLLGPAAPALPVALLRDPPGHPRDAGQRCPIVCVWVTALAASAGREGVSRQR